jgi:hypothetical protein
VQSGGCGASAVDVVMTMAIMVVHVMDWVMFLMQVTCMASHHDAITVVSRHIVTHTRTVFSHGVRGLPGPA